MKRGFWLIPALLLAALCWLRPGLRLSVNGERMEGAISPSAALRGLRVVAVTADVELQGKTAEMGFDGILLKPVTADRLAAILA